MPRTPGDRIEQRKLTRGKLIDAALRLFSTSGYEHATVDDISQTAGFSKGAYYFHFSTKDDMLLEILRMWTDAQTSGMTVAAESHERPGEALRAMLASFYAYDAAAGWPAVLLEFWSQSLRNQEVGRRVSQAYGAWRRQLTEAFARAADDGLRVESAPQAASLALTAHDGYAVQLAIGVPGDKALSAGELTDAVIASLEAAAAEPARRTGTL